MKVEKIRGDWFLLEDDGTEISRHATNAAAWRSYDKAAGQPLNKQQDKSDWLFKRRTLGG